MLHALGTLPRPHSLRFEVPYPETRNHNASSLSLTNVGKLGKLNLVCILMQHNKKNPTIEKSFTTVIKGKKKTLRWWGFCTALMAKHQENMNNSMGPLLHKVPYAWGQECKGYFQKRIPQIGALNLPICFTEKHDLVALLYNRLVATAQIYQMLLLAEKNFQTSKD